MPGQAVQQIVEQAQDEQEQQGPPEVDHLEAWYDGAGQEDHGSVDDQEKKTKSQDGHRQGNEGDQGFDGPVDQAHDQGNQDGYPIAFDQYAAEQSPAGID